MERKGVRGSGSGETSTRMLDSAACLLPAARGGRRKASGCGCQDGPGDPGRTNVPRCPSRAGPTAASGRARCRPRPRRRRSRLRRRALRRCARGASAGARRSWRRGTARGTWWQDEAAVTRRDDAASKPAIYPWAVQLALSMQRGNQTRPGFHPDSHFGVYSHLRGRARGSLEYPCSTLEYPLQQSLVPEGAEADERREPSCAESHCDGVVPARHGRLSQPA